MISHPIAENELNPTIAVIHGDGVGPSLISQTIACIDCAVAVAFNDQKKINWQTLLCGEQAACEFDGEWFPEHTLNQLEQCKVALLGPITAPLGYGFRSLNLALRHELGLNLTRKQYRAKCGVYDLLCDNTEDLPIGLEWDAASYEGAALKQFLLDELGVSKLNLQGESVFALKAHTRQVTENLVCSAVELAKVNKIDRLYITHQANKLILSEGTWLLWVEQTLQGLGLQRDDEGVYRIDGLAIMLVSVSALIERLLQDELAPGLIACSAHSADLLADTFSGYFNLRHRHSVVNFNKTHALFEPAHGPFGAAIFKDDGLACLSAAANLLAGIGWGDASQILNQAVEKVCQSNTPLNILDVQAALSSR